jgi:internalin A
MLKPYGKCQMRTGQSVREFVCTSCRAAGIVPALWALLLMLPAAATLADDGETANGESESPAAAPADTAAGQEALARLQQLGAQAGLHTNDEDEQIVGVTFSDKWQGTDADLDLLDSLSALGKVSVTVASFQTLSSQALAQVKLRQSLESFALVNATDEMIGKLMGVPAARKVHFSRWAISTAGWRRFAKVAANVKGLEIICSGGYEDGMSISDADLVAIGALQEVKSLRVFGGTMTGDGLAPLAKMKNLESLTLEYCPNLEANALTPLAEIKSLRLLNLNFPVAAEAIASIGRLEELEKLTIDIDRVAPSDIEPFANLSHLQEMEIFQLDLATKRRSIVDPTDQSTESRTKNLPVGDAIGRAAGKMKSLRTLNQRVPMGAKGVEGLAGAANLRSLRFDLLPLEGSALAPLARLTALQQLRINAADRFRYSPVDKTGQLSDDALAAFEPLTDLVVLEMMAPGITDAGLAHLAGLVKLEGLHLSGSRITGKNLSRLKALVSLRALSLDNSPFGDEGARYLPQFPKLRSLNLSQTKITDAAMDAIAELSQLRQLDIYRTAVSDAGLVNLAGLQKLKKLNANNTRVTEKGAGALKTAIAGISVGFTKAAERAPMARRPLSPGADNDLDDAGEMAEDAKVEPDKPASKRPPATPQSANAALARLQGLGAHVYDIPAAAGTERRINVSFSVLWKGDVADLALLDDLSLLGTVEASFDLLYVKPAPLGKLKLGHPLEELALLNCTDRDIKLLKSLPAARALSMTGSQLTPEGCRKLVAIAGGIERLTNHGMQKDGHWQSIDDAGLVALAELANLKELLIFGSPITPAATASIVRLKQLQRLELFDCPALDNADLSRIGELGSLRRLDLSPPISGASLKGISQLAGLEELSCTAPNMSQADAESLAKLQHLRRLWILTKRSANAHRAPNGGSALGDAIAQATRHMPELENLALDAPLSQQGLEAVASLPKVTRLDVNLTEATDESLRLMAPLHTLKALSLHGKGSLTDEGLASIKSLLNLTQLDIPCDHLTVSGLIHLARLTALESLGLTGGAITKNEILVLTKLPKLKFLSLADTTCDDSGCGALTFLTGLTALDLSRTQITDAGLKAIAKMPNLNTLVIDGTKVTEAGFAYLDAKENLQQVYARQTIAKKGEIPGGGVIMRGRTLYFLVDDRQDEPADQSEEGK